jgi:hypothetical protein
MMTTLAEAWEALKVTIQGMADLAKGWNLFEFSPGQDIESVKAEYQDKLYEYMAEYLRSSKSVVVDRNKFNRAINDGFTFAFVAGWADAGASELTPEAQSWLNGRIADEIAFAATLFADLKALREDDTIPMDAKLQAAEAHAAAYTNTLTGVYAEGKMRGEPERQGVWRLGATEEHCKTCSWLNTQKQPMSWYIDNGYIPQEAGSATLDCGGWRCDCIIEDPKTGEQIIP